MTWSSSVSVVIPAYNAAGTIERALNSVYAQECDRTIEIIVVSDGSTDGTAELVRSYRPEVVLVEQENAGAAAARNAGVKVASGKYIAFLDADDEWLPGRLNRPLRILSERPGIEHCGCLLEIRSNGRRIRPLPAAPGTLVEWEFSRFLLGGYPPLTHAVVSRRESYLRIGGEDERLRSMEEFDLWLRVLAAGQRLVVLQEYLEAWYLYPESLSQGRRGLIKHDCKLEILERWDPQGNPQAQTLLTEAEHEGAMRRALLAAACEHARYGQYLKASRFAERLAAMGNHSLLQRAFLEVLIGAPEAYGPPAAANAWGRRMLARILR